ncbi:MAG: CrcB family protein [Thermaerobacter sp.]|nr:CrcB family protein [Thermaerobacter sp.]
MLLWFAVAGLLGSLARYWTSRAAARLVPSEFPLGTLAVNWSGSFLTGLFAGTVGLGLPHATTVVVLSGFLGAYTTFSTFTYETVALLRSGERGKALWNLALSALGGAGLALLGALVA